MKKNNKCDEREEHQLFNYVYQYKDHLGNIRVSYGLDPADNVLKILEENHYYPFGLKHTHYNSSTKNYEPDPENPEILSIEDLPPGEQLLNKYKYNGKELQDELGLNMYDYGARNYDPAVGRWMNIDPKAEQDRRWSPYRYAYDNPIIYIDPDGMQEGWIEHEDKEGKQSVTYDAEINTKQEAETKGYKGVKQVLSEAKVTNKVNGDKIELNKDGTYAVNGGEAVSPFDQSYTAGGANINENRGALAQLAPVLSNSGDACVVIGVIMVLSGVASPIGAGLITYGGGASSVGTGMDLANDANNGTLTTEKVVTKAAMMAVPEVGNAAFKALGAPAAGAVINAATVGGDRALDKMRDANVGPYRKN